MCVHCLAQGLESLFGLNEDRSQQVLSNFRLLVIDESAQSAGSGVDLSASIPLGLIQSCSNAGRADAPLVTPVPVLLPSL